MKDRVKSRVWKLVGWNAGALLMVLLLAFAAGSRSGGLSVLDFGALPQIAGLEFLLAGLILVVSSIVLLVKLGHTVVNPTRELLDFSEKLVGGDYEARAEITPDDFGLIAENWNRAAELVAQASAVKSGDEMLRSELSELEKVIHQVARGELSARAAAAAHPFLTPVIESFNTLAENYARKMEKVRTASMELSTTAAQVCVNVTEMANGAEEQEQATIDAAAAISQLSHTTQQVSTHAKAASEAAREALDLSEQGSRAVHETADGMARVRKSMQTTAEKIKSLADRSLEIYEIINLIHETNLLAQNAIVEMSKGNTGSSSKALDVLSAELKKLAEHSRTTTRDIVTLLKSIQAEGNMAVSVMEDGNRVAANGSQLMDQASRAFAGIANVLNQTSDLAQSISDASSEQVSGTEHVAAAVQELASSMRENASKARQSASIVEQMVRCSDQLTQALPPARHAPGPVMVKGDRSEADAPVFGRI